MPRRAAAPDAIALLKEDHRKVEDLFEKFEKARADERQQALAREICTELTIHAMIEEEIFYPACHGQIEDEDLLDESYVEHDGAKVLISEIMSATEWRAPSNDSTACTSRPAYGTHKFRRT